MSNIVSISKIKREAKAFKKARGIKLAEAQEHIAKQYGFKDFNEAQQQAPQTTNPLHLSSQKFFSLYTYPSSVFNECPDKDADDELFYKIATAITENYYPLSEKELLDIVPCFLFQLYSNVDIHALYDKLKFAYNQLPQNIAEEEATKNLHQIPYTMAPMYLGIYYLLKGQKAGLVELNNASPEDLHQVMLSKKMDALDTYIYNNAIPDPTHPLHFIGFFFYDIAEALVEEGFSGAKEHDFGTYIRGQLDKYANNDSLLLNPIMKRIKYLDNHFSGTPEFVINLPFSRTFLTNGKEEGYVFWRQTPANNEVLFDPDKFFLINPLTPFYLDENKHQTLIKVPPESEILRDYGEWLSLFLGMVNQVVGDGNIPLNPTSMIGGAELHFKNHGIERITLVTNQNDFSKTLSEEIPHSHATALIDGEITNTLLKNTSGDGSQYRRQEHLNVAVTLSQSLMGKYGLGRSPYDAIVSDAYYSQFTHNKKVRLSFVGKPLGDGVEFIAKVEAPTLIDLIIEASKRYIEAVGAEKAVSQKPPKITAIDKLPQNGNLPHYRLTLA